MYQCVALSKRSIVGYHFRAMHEKVPYVHVILTDQSVKIKVTLVTSFSRKVIVQIMQKTHTHHDTSRIH